MATIAIFNLLLFARFYSSTNFLLYRHFFHHFSYLCRLFSFRSFIIIFLILCIFTTIMCAKNSPINRLKYSTIEIFISLVFFLIPQTRNHNGYLLCIYGVRNNDHFNRQIIQMFFFNLNSIFIMNNFYPYQSTEISTIHL